MILNELHFARAAAALSQEQVARRAGLSRMTVQRSEAGKLDPRLSTLTVWARALGLELMLVPTGVRPALQDFIRSGGKLVGQAPGVEAPLSIVDTLSAKPSKQPDR